MPVFNPPFQLSRNKSPDVSPFLNRRLRHTRHGMSLLHHRRRIADHEHPGRVHDLQKGSTIACPARSVLVPSIFGIGDAATPAVRSGSCQL